MTQKLNLAAELKKLHAGDVVSDVTPYSRDASLFQVMPAAAVAPRTVEDIEKLVQFASDHGVSITARAAGTDMSGGPLTESIVLDMMKNFNHVVKIGEDYAITQPGVYYRDFEKQTLEHGLLLPTYPASRELCAVGGMVANNSGGEKTLTYGQTKKYVMQLKAVLADGHTYVIKPLNKDELEKKMQQDDFEGGLYRKTYDLISSHHDLLEAHKPHVSKNSSGYFLWDVWDEATFDMTKLFTGSQGTLGIITEITFKLVKPKPHSKLLVMFLPDFDKVADITALTLKFGPESFESYDDKTLKLALRFLPSFVKLLGRSVFRLAIQFLPEFWMFVSGGMPKLILMAEFTGDTEDEVDEKIRRAHWALQKFNVPMRITQTEEEAKKYWAIRRESFNLLRNHLKGQRTAPFIDDMVVEPKYLPKFLPQMEKMLEPYHLVYSIAGHVGNGNFHIIPLMKIGDPHIKEIIPELSKKVYDLILQYHGSITGEHNDGMIRTPFLKQMYGEQMYALFEQTKQIFDPKNIFNPGKKVGGSFQYAMDHIQTGQKI